MAQSCKLTSSSTANRTDTHLAWPHCGDAATHTCVALPYHMNANCARTHISQGPIAVLLTPTRDLAQQTYTEAMKFARPLNLRVVCIYGGANISEQIAELRRGAEVVVCTPGRMIDMLTSNNGTHAERHRGVHGVGAEVVLCTPGYANIKQ